MHLKKCSVLLCSSFLTTTKLVSPMKINVDDKLKQRRFVNTLKFMEKSTAKIETVLDVGAPNQFSSIMSEHGYKVENTSVDLDKNPQQLKNYSTDAATAFEIFEHLLNPLGVLENLNADHLFATIPLRLWFKSAYRNPKDPWDCHFHEFEDWQFDWLLDHAGWEIIRSEKWTSPINEIGFRPLLRRFTPRYYAIEAIKK